MVPDWPPGRLTQRSVHSPTPLTWEKTRGERKGDTPLHTYCVLYPSKTLTSEYLPMRKRDVIAEAIRWMCDRYRIQAKLPGHSIQLSTPPTLQMQTSHHRRLSVNMTWFESTWMSFSQTVMLRFFNHMKSLKKPINSPVISCEPQPLQQEHFGFCLGGIGKQKWTGLTKGRQPRGRKASRGSPEAALPDGFHPTPCGSGMVPLQELPSSLLRRTSNPRGSSSTEENPSLGLLGWQMLLLQDGKKAEVLSARDLNLSSGQF